MESVMYNSLRMQFTGTEILGLPPRNNFIIPQEAEVPLGENPSS